MHTTTARIQNVFGFFTSVSFVVALLTALSVLLYPANPSASVDVVKAKVIKGRPNYYYSKQQEYAFITFDLDADLSSLYNWNTKQVFAWLSVKYDGDNNTPGVKHVSFVFARSLVCLLSCSLAAADLQAKVRERSDHLGCHPAVV
jgi:signal peptidase complex subunit 3